MFGMRSRNYLMVFAEPGNSLPPLRGGIKGGIPFAEPGVPARPKFNPTPHCHSGHRATNPSNSAALPARASRIFFLFSAFQRFRISAFSSGSLRHRIAALSTKRHAAWNFSSMRCRLLAADPSLPLITQPHERHAAARTRDLAFGIPRGLLHSKSLATNVTNIAALRHLYLSLSAFP